MFKKTILIFLLLSFSSALIAGTSSSNQKKASSWVSLENLQELLKEFEITTVDQFLKEHPIINAKAKKLYGKKVPKNPAYTYKTTWNEIRGETKVSLEIFKELLKKHDNITTLSQYQSNYPKINAEAKKLYGKKVPTDPARNYKISWNKIIGKETIEMVSLEIFKELLKEFNITTKAQFLEKHPIINAKSQELYGKKVPKNPTYTYKTTWNEIIGKKTIEIVSLENLQGLLKEFEITTLPQYKKNYPIINAKSQELYGKKAPADPHRSYDKRWNEITGKATKECVERFKTQDKIFIEEGQSFSQQGVKAETQGKVRRASDFFNKALVSFRNGGRRDLAIEVQSKIKKVNKKINAKKATLIDDDLF